MTKTETAPPDAPLGWRAKIGVITPTVNSVTEPELNAMRPDGVTVHFTRMPIHFHPEEDGYRSLMEDLSIRLDELRTCGVTIAAYNCTVGSMACPTDMLLGKMREVTGVPAVATASAMVAALGALGAKRIGLATPYSDEVNAHEAEYLARHGITVVASAGKTFPPEPVQGQAFARVPPAEILRHARSVDRPEADAIFISCANFASASVVDILEKELGRPVVTSNIAVFWAALRAAGIGEAVEGYGRLLREH